MRILLLCDYFAAGGGAGEIAKIQAEALAETGEVQVLAAHAPADFHPRNYKLAVLPLDYHPVLRNYLGLYHPKAIKILKSRLNSFKPEVCRIHNLHTNWSYHSLKILKQAGVRTILTFHDVAAVTPYIKFCGNRDYKYPWARHLRDAKFTFNPLRNVIIRKYLSLARETIAVSNALADFLRTNGIRVDRVVHNKLPQAEQEPNSTYNDSIFFGGRLSSSKGALEAVEYLAKLRENYRLDVRLLVAGIEGIITEKMKARAVALGVGEFVKFLGWLDKDQYEAAMRNCGVVIVPSICFDSFPTMILEAMRAARPVVATIYGGSREMVEEGKTGFIRDPKNIPEFTGAIAQILRDPKQYGQAGYLKFMEKFRLS